jgi:hypothetical protein
MDLEEFISEFEENDQVVANALVASILNISSDEMHSELRKCVSSIPKGTAKLALYVERELEGGKHKQPIFNPIIGRAIQPKNIPLVKPIRGRVKVGSEGPLARLASTVKSNNSLFVLSPGPETIRNKKIRHIIILTDIIGSGDRIKKMLDSFYKVGTVRSWLSGKFVKFHVVAYAASDTGKRSVQLHKTKPRMHICRPLPTINTEFFSPKDGVTLTDIVNLCKKYDPLASIAPGEPLGYGNVGALLTIAGRCPNNAPRLLWGEAGRWTPLFMNFVTNEEMPTCETHFDRMVRILQVFGRGCSIKEGQLRQIWIEARPLIVLLVALRKGNRRLDKLASLTRLSYEEISYLLDQALTNGWIDKKFTLTEEGRSLVGAISRTREVRNSLSPSEEILYLPKQLRAPVPLPSPAT